MLENLGQKKYASITVQSVLLATNTLLLGHRDPNIFTILSMVLVLSLFALQAINHRFFYYFPLQTWALRPTPNIDTYILYLLTFLATLFLLLGITDSLSMSLLFTALIVVPPFLWRRFMFQIIRRDIARNLNRRPLAFYGSCPYCKGEAVFGRKVISPDEGIQFRCCQFFCVNSS